MKYENSTIFVLRCEQFAIAKAKWTAFAQDTNFSKITKLSNAAANQGLS